ncbi:unnamed protein product [Amoebophrya sp. A120]|nr:unnamed protein product [Amoebophrya sp. A120]|eukprot:GSA120T00007581001.1
MLKYGENDRFEVLERHVGEGTYGKVIKCRDNLTSSTVALKKIKAQSSQISGLHISSIRELKTMSICRHDNLISMVTAFVDAKSKDLILVMPFLDLNLRKCIEQHQRDLVFLLKYPVFIAELEQQIEHLTNQETRQNAALIAEKKQEVVQLMERYREKKRKEDLLERSSGGASASGVAGSPPPGGTSSSRQAFGIGGADDHRWHNKNNYHTTFTRLTNADIACMMKQILTACAYLHEELNLVHRDLKPDNVLCDANTGLLKITDFGLATGSTVGDPIWHEDFDEEKEESVLRVVVEPKKFARKQELLRKVNGNKKLLLKSTASPSSKKRRTEQGLGKMNEEKRGDQIKTVERTSTDARILGGGGPQDSSATTQFEQEGLNVEHLQPHANYVEPVWSMSPNVVSLWYRAPEVLLRSYFYGFGIDLWSVGCIFAELVVGSILFQSPSEFEQLPLILNSMLSYGTTAGMSDGGRNGRQSTMTTEKPAQAAPPAAATSTATTGAEVRVELQLTQKPIPSAQKFRREILSVWPEIERVGQAIPGAGVNSDTDNGHQEDQTMIPVSVYWRRMEIAEGNPAPAGADGTSATGRTVTGAAALATTIGGAVVGRTAPNGGKNNAAVLEQHYREGEQGRTSNEADNSGRQELYDRNNSWSVALYELVRQEKETQNGCLSFLNSLVALDPNKRIAATDLLENHPFLVRSVKLPNALPFVQR